MNMRARISRRVSNGKKNLLANGTFPRASIAVHLKVGFQIEALDVFALVPSGRQCYPLEGDGAF